jgi:hypothetical protein
MRNYCNDNFSAFKYSVVVFLGDLRDCRDIRDGRDGRDGRDVVVLNQKLTNQKMLLLSLFKKIFKQKRP